jgi:phosphatidylglycerol:prolipoprotein diacylglycerol transferase
MLAAIPFPNWLRPEIIPGLPLFRWYGLMYVVAFAVVFALFKWQARGRLAEFDADTTLNFFFAGIAGLVLGARLFGTLVYGGNMRLTYLTKPWLIFWPFGEGWQYTGLTGMSYHGGLIGCVLGTWIYAKRKKLDYLVWADMVMAGVPFAYTFGRLGNFINGELYGRVTGLPWGMIFPAAESFSARDPWVLDMAKDTGIKVSSMNAMVNLPRHPSQLYEALFEGVVLGLVMWFILRKHKPFKGFMLGAYLIGYGFVRFILEYFRAPDDWMGYAINLSGLDLSSEAALRAGAVARFMTPWAFSTGQLFCFLMMVAGGLFLWFLSRRRDPCINQPAAPEAPSARKLRRRLR